MKTVDTASFRDNAGFVFFEDGTPFRHVAEPYRANWDALSTNGLLSALQKEGLLISHEEVPFSAAEHPDAIAILRPEKVPFVSYPYEWSFTQLKDAALATLEIQRRSLAVGMSLKDASAYNIQFLQGRPILIDTLSFETYEEGRPWQAYRQFCRHFLAPLALMAKVHHGFGLMFQPHLDGIPLEAASRALPWRTHLHPGLAVHLHLHAKAEKNRSAPGKGASHVSKLGLMGLLDSLERTVRGLDWEPSGTVWSDYYSDTNYSDEAMAAKRALVGQFLGELPTKPACIWDLGANTGEFSRIAAKHAGRVIAWDVDAAAVDRHYRAIRKESVETILPLVQDLTNPSPGIGWAGEERASLAARADADVLMALALVHHLAIGNNVPLLKIAEYLARLGPVLLIEFVPKEDSQTQRLLASRRDIFDGYSPAGFEEAFSKLFELVRKAPIEGTKRVLYLWKRRNLP